MTTNSKELKRILFAGILHNLELLDTIVRSKDASDRLNTDSLPTDKQLLHIWAGIEDYFVSGWQMSPQMAIDQLQTPPYGNNLQPPDNTIDLQEHRWKKRMSEQEDSEQ